MDFFNKLTQKAKETYKEASQKTGELAKEAKLKMKMNENKSDINDLYKEIGKKVYEKHTLSESIDIKTDLEEECTKIDLLSAEIESCLNQIRELKDKKQCPNCFNEIDLESNFCNHCGAKQEEREAKEVEVIEVVEDFEKPEEVENSEQENGNGENSAENLEQIEEEANVQIDANTQNSIQNQE